MGEFGKGDAGTVAASDIQFFQFQRGPDTAYASLGRPCYRVRPTTASKSEYKIDNFPLTVPVSPATQPANIAAFTTISHN